MYTITVVRYNVYNGVNKEHKGAFKMQFETLDKLVAFMKGCKLQSIYFPYLKEELTKREHIILRNKLVAFQKKHLTNESRCGII